MIFCAMCERFIAKGRNPTAMRLRPTGDAASVLRLVAHVISAKCPPNDADAECPLPHIGCLPSPDSCQAERNCACLLHLDKTLPEVTYGLCAIEMDKPYAEAARLTPLSGILIESSLWSIPVVDYA